MDQSQLPQPGQSQSPMPTSPQPGQSGGQFNAGQYDFITDPHQPAKKSRLPGTGSSKTQRILIVVAGLVILLMLAFILMSLLNSGKKSNTEQLTGLLQSQTEISRVAQAGQSKASGDKAKTIASTTDIVVDSQKNQLNDTVTKLKIEVNTKQLGAKKNAETDQALTAAEKNGRFDDAFIQAIRSELEAYQKSLKTAYDGSNSKTVRELLDEHYKQVNLLLEDITQP